LRFTIKKGDLLVKPGDKIPVDGKKSLSEKAPDEYDF
jgi:cation transport ATPase